jgi:tetratricopeptide (TPR) repeat protein
MRIMKSVAAVGLLLLGAAFLRADTSLPEARLRWLHGNYDEARALYEELTKDAKLKSPAAIGVSQCWQSQGEYDKALEVIEKALGDSPKDAALNARHAELLYLRGRWDDAVKAVTKALDENKNQLLARWVRVQVLRDRGETAKAKDEVVWFIRFYNDNDVKDPDDLLLVGLASLEHARWNKLSDQFEFVLNELFNVAARPPKGQEEKTYWPAEYQAGALLLEKYNRGEALDAFDKALTINPNCAEALVGKGYCALIKLEIKDAESFAERALKVNPQLPDALRLRADVDLATGDVTATRKELDRATKVNPRDEATLARIAACLMLEHKDKEYEALTQEVLKFDPKPAEFYYELGDRLEERRRFDDAEKCFKKASEYRPFLAGPYTSLGMLYMRMGREKEARKLLDQGFEWDRFNVRVSNTLKVLKHLDKYDTLKTEHFEVRYDPKNDAALAGYMADYLEEIYVDLAKKFQYRPKERILLEIFNRHDMFSGRVTALPDLHTIGACTGRMVAMASPNAVSGVRKPFNWARVLRHEMVHIFNLEQTNFLTPHWLTEGLAVGNEGFPRPPLWNELLVQRVAAGETMDLDSIDLGFIRPRNQGEWHMAYAQSQLYVEYMKGKFGDQTVGQLLDAYREGLSTDTAIQKVCKVDKAAFEAGYKEYLKETVKQIQGGKPVEKPKTRAELKKALEKDPDNVDLKADLALVTLDSDRVEARKLATQVLEKKAKQPKASYVLARLEHLGGNVEKELSLLEEALDKANPDPLILQALAKIYYDAGKFAEAGEVAELGRKTEPQKADWLQLLARVYAQTEDKEKQIAVLKDLVPTDADDIEHRARLARLLLEADQPAEAEKYARQALEIDIRNKDAREMLYRALGAQKKDAEADRVKKLLEKPNKDTSG